MFSSFTKALNDAGNQVSKAANNAVKSLENMNKEMEAKCAADDKTWFAEIGKVPLQAMPMDAVSFNQLRANYNNAGVPNEKQRVIQEACRSGNGFTCQQIISIIQCGGVPLETVGAATWMYPRCVDVANWHNVYSAYDVPNSKDWLKRRIQECPKPTPMAAAGMNMQMGGMNVSMPGVSVTMNTNMPTATMNATMPTATMNVPPQQQTMVTNVTLEQRVAALEATMQALLVHLNLVHLRVMPGQSGAVVQQNVNVDMGAMMNAAVNNAAVAANNASMQMGNVQVQNDMNNAMMMNSGPNAAVSVNMNGMPGATVNTMNMNDGMGTTMNASSMNAPIAGGQVTASSGSFESVGANSYSQGSSSSVSATQTQNTSMNFGGMQMQGTVTTSSSSSQSQSSSFSMSGM